jgi:membrane protein
MTLTMRALGRTFVAAGRQFLEDKSPRLAASLSYYTVFSLPPLLVSLIAVAGLAFGADEVRERLVTQLGGLMGADAADMLGGAVRDAQQAGSGLALGLGVGALLLGASGTFGQLQDALNTVWDVEPPESGGVVRFVRARFLSFASVLGAGFLLLVSLAVSTAIGAVVDTFERFDAIAPFLFTVDLATSFAVITVVFALIFKFLPDVTISWRHVWWGAAITSALFVIGKFAIGFYIGASEVGSAYGAAGSLIVVLVWIYYSSIILLYGAEFTQVWSTRGASEETAEPSSPEERPPSDRSLVATALVWIGLIVWGRLRRRRAG